MYAFELDDIREAERLRAGAAQQFERLERAQPPHLGRRGLRASVGQWVDEVPVGKETLTYAQIDTWKTEAFDRWRTARRRELVGDEAAAQEGYRVAARLLGACALMLEGIEARHGGAACR